MAVIGPVHISFVRAAGLFRDVFLCEIDGKKIFVSSSSIVFGAAECLEPGPYVFSELIISYPIDC